MSSNSSNPDVKPVTPRVRFIWNCKPAPDFRTAVISMAACIFGTAAFVFLLRLLVISLFKGHGRLALWFMFISVIAYFTGMFKLGLEALPYRPRSRNPCRIRRLQWVLSRSDAMDRVPHRHVEYAKYKYPDSSKRLKRQMAMLAPGAIVVIDSKRSDDAWRIPITTEAFEPIFWQTGESRLAELISFAASTRGSAERRGTRSGRHRLIQRNGPILLLSILILSGAALYLIPWRMGLPGLHSFGAWPILYMFISCIVGVQFLVIGKKYFLVPGGLVRLKNGLVYRKATLKLLTPQNASVVIDARIGSYVITNGVVSSIWSDPVMNQSLIVAWLSQARAPTMQELCTLLAPDGVQVSHSVREV